jgi:hypothetical protein
MSAMDLFWDLVTQEGVSLTIQCGWCGRTHFATGNNPGDYEDGELEALRRKAKDDPDHYLEDAWNGGIAWGHLDGRLLVWKCPCEAGLNIGRYERFIWDHRRMIAAYIKARAAAQLKQANQDSALLTEDEA